MGRGLETAVDQYGETLLGTPGSRNSNSKIGLIKTKKSLYLTDKSASVCYSHLIGLHLSVASIWEPD